MCSKCIRKHVTAGHTQQGSQCLPSLSRSFPTLPNHPPRSITGARAGDVSRNPHGAAAAPCAEAAAHQAPPPRPLPPPLPPPPPPPPAPARVARAVRMLLAESPGSYTRARTVCQKHIAGRLDKATAKAADSTERGEEQEGRRMQKRARGKRREGHTKLAQTTGRPPSSWKLHSRVILITHLVRHHPGPLHGLFPPHRRRRLPCQSRRGLEPRARRGRGRGLQICRSAPLRQCQSISDEQDLLR